MSERSDLIAIHEAGHCTAAELLGQRVDCAEISRSGASIIESSDSRISISVALAGPVAEKMFARFRFDSPGDADLTSCAFDAARDILQGENGMGSDLKMLMQLWCEVTKGNGINTDAFSKFIYADGKLVAQLLAKNWPALIAVAQLIGTYRPIDGSEIRNTMRAMDAKPHFTPVRQMKAIAPHRSDFCLKISNCSLAG